MAPLATLLQRGQEKAEEFLRNGVDTWVEEGRIDGDRREQFCRASTRRKRKLRCSTSAPLRHQPAAALPLRRGMRASSTR